LEGGRGKGLKKIYTLKVIFSSKQAITTKIFFEKNQTRTEKMRFSLTELLHYEWPHTREYVQITYHGMHKAKKVKVPTGKAMPFSNAGIASKLGQWHDRCLCPWRA
jgi:hypothetical protein